jgi:glutaminase
MAHPARVFSAGDRRRAHATSARAMWPRTDVNGLIAEAINPEIQDRVMALGLAAAEGGTVTKQIPALRSQDPRKFGVAIATTDGETVTFGDAHEPISLQSVSKVFALCALVSLDTEAWSRIGWGQSAQHHDSVADLDRGQRPANPFVNSGAISVTDQVDVLVGSASAAVQSILRSQTRPHGWLINERVAASESTTSHRNRAIAHLLADRGHLHNDPETVLRQYFHQCAIEGSAHDLALASLFLADVDARFHVLPRDERRRVNSVLLMSGTYAAAADVSFRVGLPAKSAISGVIVAVAPGRGSIVVWSPPLDEHGNSSGALVALEALAKALDWSIFGGDKCPR